MEFVKMLEKIRVRNSVSIPLSIGKTGIFYTFFGFEKNQEHFAIMLGAPDKNCPLVRVHSECMTGDVFQSLRCDCGNQLKEAMEVLSDKGGYLIYLRQEGRGIGFYHKIDAYVLQNQGLDTYEANKKLNFPEDAREFDCAASILEALEIKSIKLLSNNPSKLYQISDYGIKVMEMIPT
jgi:GTP cyclohydrolase II